jgi:hypothetical protein
MVSKSVQIIIFVALTLGYVYKVSGITCYACLNCEESFNSTHLSNCSKSTTVCMVSNRSTDLGFGDSFLYGSCSKFDMILLSLENGSHEWGN